MINESLLRVKEKILEVKIREERILETTLISMSGNRPSSDYTFLSEIAQRLKGEIMVCEKILKYIEEEEEHGTN